MAHMMTTKELAKYLQLHEITVCKYAAQGKIPAIRIGRVWRFDKDAIDRWITEGTVPVKNEGSKEDEKGKKKHEQGSGGGEKT
jgi:excisionase family DNA binding protein